MKNKKQPLSRLLFVFIKYPCYRAIAKCFVPRCRNNRALKELK